MLGYNPGGQNAPWFKSPWQTPLHSAFILKWLVNFALQSSHLSCNLSDQGGAKVDFNTLGHDLSSCGDLDLTAKDV